MPMIFSTVAECISKQSTAQIQFILYNRNDTRSFGISVNYKIPTRNKLAKVDQNILNQDAPKEDNGGIMKQ